MPLTLPATAPSTVFSAAPVPINLHGAFTAEPSIKHQSTPDTPALIHQLVVLAAFCKELELQAHLIHLNYTGPDFLPLHQFLKAQYQLHQEEFDSLAEFVRTQGAFLPTSNAALRAVLPCFCDCDASDSLAMVATYAENLAQQAEMARNLDQSAAAERAIDVQNYAAELVAAANKAIWFLSASR